MCCCCCSCCSHRCGSLYRFAFVIAYSMSPNVMLCFVEPVRFVVQLNRFVRCRHTPHYKCAVVDCFYVSRFTVIAVEVTATCIDQQNQRPLGRIRYIGGAPAHIKPGQSASTRSALIAGNQLGTSRRHACSFARDYPCTRWPRHRASYRSPHVVVGVSLCSRALLYPGVFQYSVKDLANSVSHSTISCAKSPTVSACSVALARSSGARNRGKRCRMMAVPAFDHPVWLFNAALYILGKCFSF